MVDESELVEGVEQALVGDVDPARLEGFRFARSILPVFRLVRALFSQNELDSCLKLMVLYELTRAGGRATIEAVRVRASFLDPARVDALVLSLRDGGWLDLRASDRTYAVSAEGLNLLAILRAASFEDLSPANALARAAQNAAFGATLDGATDATPYLLDQLLRLLEDQVEHARSVLLRGRPHQMIAWSRRQHGRQLDVIRQVLGALQERMDDSSREFARVVRLHEAMQETVRLHEGIHVRLRDWNLERLHTSEAGYSLPELCEAVLGVDDEPLFALLRDGIVQLPARVPCLGVDEIAARFHALRRRLPEQAEPFSYAPPDDPTIGAFAAATLDPAAALRARLTALLADGAAPLELEAWLRAEGFAGVAYELATLARIEEDGGRVRLDDGRAAFVHTPAWQAAGVAPEDLVAELVAGGALRPLAAGHFSRLTVALARTASGRGEDDDG